MFIENEHEGFCIPQKDGSGDGDAADIKPNTNAPFGMFQTYVCVPSKMVS